MNYLSGGVAALAVLLSSGCASITTGHNQTLSVETRSQGTSVPDAKCQLTNDKGTWFVSTPGSVTVRRSFADMQVRCEKPGYGPAVAKSSSHTKAMVAGNVIFGGLIGAAVDVASGAAYDYDSLMTIELSFLAQ